MLIKTKARFYRSEEEVNAAKSGIEICDYELKPVLINPVHITNVIPTLDNTGIVVYMTDGGNLTLNTTMDEFGTIWEFALKSGLFTN